MVKGSQVTLSRTDRATMVRLLGILQDHLESCIETGIVKETGEPMPGDTLHIASVAKDRRDWRTAEDMIKKLQAKSREK